MNASNSQLNKLDGLLTVKDVMRLLGISQSSVYRLVEKRLIRHYKPRFGLRFKLGDVQEYLDGCLVEAINENVYGSTKEKR